MTGVPPVRMPSLIAASLAASFVLGGCGSDDEPDAAPTRPTAQASDRAARTPTASPTPSATASQTPEATPTKHGGRHKIGALQPRARSAAAAHLLDAARLPTVGERAWTVDATAPEDAARDDAVGACQKTPLGSIGAVEAVRRTFSASAGLAATQVVARFADSRSAWRAHGVLVAWRDECEERLGTPHAEVGPLQPVTVHAGTGETYLAAYGSESRARQRAAGLGILRTGSYLTLVEISAGPDDYPDAWDPTRVAVRRIARTF